jgi:hypothetical protein
MARLPLLVVLALSVAAAAREGVAAEWHESYHEGLKALAQGQPSRAVSLLEQAARQRPEPGRNVITYGTNVENRYYPYLNLAEAYLQLRDLAGVRSALQRSERWNREPADERRRLAARADELAARLTPPAPSATPTAAPAPARESPPDTVAAPTAVPTPVPTAAAVPPPPKPTDRPAFPQRPAPMPSALPGPPSITQPAAPPPTAAGVLEVVSQPPGASAYLDDEFIGATDSEWGRLVRTGVPAGRHRVRLTLAGHADLVEPIDVGAGGRTELRRRLTPLAPAIDRRYVLFGGVALVLLALTGWALRRPGPAGLTPPAPTPRRPFDDAGPTPARPTPSASAGPGARRDADGCDYFGEYRLLEALGRGGMASVYKAERRGEICALKRPLPAFL